MVHEVFGLPDRMHDLMGLAVADAALIFALPLVLALWLLWRDRHRIRKVDSHSKLRSRRRRRRRRTH